MEGVTGEFFGFLNLSWQAAGMLLISCVLLWLGIAKKVEPVLLVPIGIGCMLANIPLGGVVGEGGFLTFLIDGAIHTMIVPVLIFVGVGAMIDFETLLRRPYTILLGGAAQFGIFATFFLVYLVGDGWLHLLDFSLKDAAAVGMIGSADGPMCIYAAIVLQSKYLAPIVVAAYSYMAMVPVIMPPVIKALTSKEERAVKMPIIAGTVAPRAKLLFPVITIIVVCLAFPKATPIIGALMFGNLLRESSGLATLARGAENELTNICTIILGICVGGMMVGTEFLTPETILIFVIGVVAFALDTAAGVLLAKVMCALSGRKINPMIGGCGISAFPMAARVVQKMGLEANPHNHLLMHALGANTAGQIASVVAGGAVLLLVPIFT
jgi:oxaloacetate decarboxylase beta subunit